MTPLVEPSAFTRLVYPDLDVFVWEKGSFFFGDTCCGKRWRWVFFSSPQTAVASHGYYDPSARPQTGLCLTLVAVWAAGLAPKA